MAVTADSYGAMFEAGAGRHPQQPALRHGDAAVSYAELESRTRALAALLRTRPGPVAVVLDRSPAQIVSMLAALRAGRPYVPLQPDQAPARLDIILRQLQPSWLICDQPLLQSLSDDWTDAHLAADIDPDSGSDSLPPVTGSTPAYVIYTSGSTGTPKGVQVSHGALVQRIAWLMAQFPLESGEPVLHNTSAVFDVSVAEIFWPLASGATLVLSNPRSFRDPGYLGDLIRRERITTALFVPSALSALLQAPASPDDLLRLVRVLCAGEALPLPLAQNFHRVTTARLFNIYGPTEATIYATCSEIRPQDSRVSIGRPIANTRAVVVNDALRVQPPGVTGELCLSGPGLADGYFANPALTWASFVDGAVDGARWYRTGDRACMSTTGEIFFGGRTDSQIKLRGYRIELGEIEQVLRGQPGVADAAVTAHADHPGARPQRLAAWLVASVDVGAAGPGPGHRLTAANWRETLRRQLPDYMIPNTLRWLPELPRLASGKLDIHRLPQPRGDSAHRFAAPATPKERTMAAAWAAVLELPAERIGLHSNFFELGGDSLMLIALAGRLEAAGLYVDINDLFENPTIAAALPLVRRSTATLIDQSAVHGRFPLLPRHRKFFADDFEYPAHWNRTFLLRFDRHLDHAALVRALQAVTRHHDGLRSSFQRDQHGEWLNIHRYQDVPLGIETMDLCGLPAANREDAMIRQINEANASLRLDTPPLLRTLRFDDEQQSTVVLVIHHLLIDMRSCYILLEDLLNAYQASIAHRPIRLPAKTTSVSEWSQRLHRLMDGQRRTEELPFWEYQLQHASHPVPRDTAIVIPALDGNQRTLTAELDPELSERLIRGFCVDAGLGVHEVLLAAFAEAFRAWSGSSWLSVNTCGIGRDRIVDGVDLTRTVGELNTVFPLSIDLSPTNVLATVRDLYRSLPSNGLHYGMLRYLGRHTALQREEPRVFFNYVSRLDGSAASMLGVTVDMAPAGVNSSHPYNRSCYALYLEGFVQNKRLTLHLGYDAGRFLPATMQRLLEHWRHNIIAYAHGVPDAHLSG